ncbi:hypothetical protein B0A48_13324 [Cryoendolithus antarcticus]|uniref:RNase III domain-containing protein n=1 Tax=Cryoendolithus antarcticus TaxID=1507870 RepID=A0A1V8SQ05_9PEZI|nr:hypothetical protein B0A48_13324 [Cryoendolithus antarcticus]
MNHYSEIWQAFMMKRAAQDHVERDFGYRFKSKALLAQALDASGMGQADGNKRLALLGDKMAAAVVTAEWYMSGAPRASADRLIQAQSDADLAATTRSIDLVDIITFNPGLSKRQALASAKTLANALEAILGAIYIDSGNDLNAVKAALESLSIPTSPSDAGE